MPAGDTPAEQLESARKIVSALTSQEGVTPEFIQSQIVNIDGPLRSAAAQIYGPAPFDAQAQRFVTCEIRDPDGGGKLVRPDIRRAFAVGMRAPTMEEAFLVACIGAPKDVMMDGGNVASAVLTTLDQFFDARLATKKTATERMDPFGQIAKGIVLAVDAATGHPKPIRLETAAGIFNLSSLNVVLVSPQGEVVSQYQNVQPALGIA